MAKVIKKNKLDLTKKISIRQFCDPEVPNMGLEKYNLSLFSGANGEGGIKENLGYKQIGNKRFYQTGLDVNADYLNLLPEDVREAKKIEIQSTIEYLEGIFGEGMLDSKNEEFWKEQFIELKRPVVDLDLTESKDLLTYYSIMGGGYSEIAPSFDVAKNSSRTYKFYLHQDQEVSDNKAENLRLRNGAIAKLDEIDREDPAKLFKLAKILLPITKSFTHKTPSSQFYADLNDYILGVYSKNDPKIGPRRFFEAVELDRATLNTKAIIKEALHQQYVVRNEDRNYCNSHTLTPYGKSENEILAFLLNPINADEYNTLSVRVNKLWD